MPIEAAMERAAVLEPARMPAIVVDQAQAGLHQEQGQVIVPEGLPRDHTVLPAEALDPVVEVIRLPDLPLLQGVVVVDLQAAVHQDEAQGKTKKTRS
jgi:hypothetical protein